MVLFWTGYTIVYVDSYCLLCCVVIDGAHELQEPKSREVLYYVQ